MSDERVLSKYTKATYLDGDDVLVIKDDLYGTVHLDKEERDALMILLKKIDGE